MSKSDKPIKLNEIARSVTVGQAWTIGGILLAVASGIFGLGGWIQSTRGDFDLGKKNAEILEKDRTIASLNTKIGDSQRVVEALTLNLQNTLATRDALETKAEFLNRLASYLQWHDATNKKLLEDVVCSMWKQSQQKRIQLTQRPVRLSPDDFRKGLPPDVEKLLIAQGVSSELLTRLRTNNFLPNEQVVTPAPFAVRRPAAVNPFNNPSEALGVVSKAASNVTVIKVIKFADGAQYEMPQEIAAAVHLRSDCAP